MLFLLHWQKNFIFSSWFQDKELKADKPSCGFYIQILIFVSVEKFSKNVLIAAQKTIVKINSIFLTKFVKLGCFQTKQPEKLKLDKRTSEFQEMLDHHTLSPKNLSKNFLISATSWFSNDWNLYYLAMEYLGPFYSLSLNTCHWTLWEDFKNSANPAKVRFLSLNEPSEKLCDQPYRNKHWTKVFV